MQAWNQQKYDARTAHLKILQQLQYFSMRTQACFLGLMWSLFLIDCLYLSGIY